LLGLPKIIDRDASADRMRLRTIPPRNADARLLAVTTAIAARVPLPLSITTHLGPREPRTRDAPIEHHLRR
jgi:hypothetical protein